MVIIMLCYTITGQRKTARVYTVNPKLPPADVVSTGPPCLYGPMVSRWRKRWRNLCCNRTINAAVRKIVHIWPPTHAVLQHTPTHDPYGGN